MSLSLFRRPLCLLFAVLAVSCTRREAPVAPSTEAASTISTKAPPTDEPEAEPASQTSDAPLELPAAMPAGEDLRDTDGLKPLPRKPDVHYVPTPEEVVERMLKLAGVKKTDVVYDLGCGDGRIVVTAAKKYGVKAKGFDIDPGRVREARKNVEENGVGHLVTIEQADIFTLDLSEANVVMLYLLPELNVRLIPQLEKLKRGSRIVSHDFDMEGVIPEKHVTMTLGPPSSTSHSIYLWTTPLKKEAD